MRPFLSLQKYSNHFNLRSIFSKPKLKLPECEVKPGISKHIEHSHTFEAAYKKLIDGNVKFAAEKKALDPEYFKNLSVKQKPNYLMIGCSDSRVPPNEMTKTEPGEMFIHRNIANQVSKILINPLSPVLS
jgi:Carbonic anhydrase